MIYVTHDQIEAMTLADRIAVMRGGVIQQLDAPQAIYNRPVNRFVAGFLGSPGMNFLDGQIAASGSTFKTADAGVPLARYKFERQRRRRTAGGARHSARAYRRRRRSRPAAIHAKDRGRDRRADGLRHAGLDQARRRQFRLPRRGREAAPQPGDQIAIGFDPARASLFGRRRSVGSSSPPSPSNRKMDNGLVISTLSARATSKPWPEVLKTLGKLGYKKVEGFGGVYDDPKAFRAELDKQRPRQCRAAHFSLDVLENDFASALRNRQGARRQADRLPAHRRRCSGRPTPPAGADFGKRLAKIGKKVKATRASDFAWHNHDFEFRPAAGRLGAA